MADAWTTLTGNSEVSSGDAWTHLINQKTGSILIYGPISVDLESIAVSSDLTSNALDTTVSTLTLESDTDRTLDANLTTLTLEVDI